MNRQIEKSAVETLIAAYAAAINSSDGNLIPTFYTQDALFMPNGIKPLSMNDLAKDSENLFKKANYLITYSVQNVTIENDYAFVEAKAVVTSTILEGGQKLTKKSQDFFVLRKEQDNWRIFRYMFNSVKAQ